MHTKKVNIMSNSIKNTKPTMYKLTFYKAGNDVEQETLFTSLAGLIMQVKSDYDTNALQHIDQVVSVTYTDENKQKQSATIALLQQLKWGATPQLKDEVINRLNYLRNCC
jgi:hypothetical protein